MNRSFSRWISRWPVALGFVVACQTALQGASPLNHAAAAAFRAQGIRAGYNLEIDLAAVPAGSYDLVIVLDQASSAYCDLGTRLVLE